MLNVIEGSSDIASHVESSNVLNGFAYYDDADPIKPSGSSIDWGGIVKDNIGGVLDIFKGGGASKGATENAGGGAFDDAIKQAQQNIANQNGGGNGGYNNPPAKDDTLKTVLIVSGVVVGLALAVGVTVLLLRKK